MKSILHTILTILIFTSCNEKEVKKPLAQIDNKVIIEDFPKIWSRITEIENEPTLYYPCSGGDQSIQLSKLSDGNYNIIINYKGQYWNSQVNEIRKKENGYILETKNQMSHHTTRFQVELINSKKNLWVWKWPGSDNSQKILYTPFKENNEFPIVYQPCKECPDIPCVDKETKEGAYEFTLPYALSLDGNDYRELSFLIKEDSTSYLRIYYYPDNLAEDGELKEYFGKATIDSTHVIIKFDNFNSELTEYFNPKDDNQLEFLNDTVFRFKKTIEGLTIDKDFCQNWELKKYSN
ncbi:hypothetical protein [Robertkochia sediminum]|uniref:hypothetical protein n=1 Tax=Robertkochia sediminum TaxID=2785326 RepID=UPI0019342A1E|nr:hypothetical protein [Robertkochia sediminum]MBL7471221.1 hypothetical protein [Robertkochia sediminum]